MCKDVEAGIICPSCISEHNFRHDQWSTNAYAQGIPAENIPGPEWINTSDSETSSSSTGLPFIGQTANSNARMCPWCEQRVNVTDHICKAASDTIDAKMLLSRLKVKE